MSGPSPRGWGNRIDHLPRRPQIRAIPTRVGKSLHGPRRKNYRPGHPHAGGEIRVRGAESGLIHGPSPRGWGNHRLAVPTLAHPRAIPTRVGKSVWCSTSASSFAGHPHAGGEIRHSKRWEFTATGPSPRGWGNLLDQAGVCGVVRAIPTRVGKSNQPPAPPPPDTGHPHAGGEIPDNSAVPQDGSGPSPRGWGNPDQLGNVCWRRRAIPTRVGKSLKKALCSVAHPGHPHAGGEIEVDNTARSVYSGPSPRGWGNLAAAAGVQVSGRAIPTRVGKSRLGAPASIRPAGHPHAGGEIAAALASDDEIPGPSPRGWGNRIDDHRGARTLRAIPTRVGKSPWSEGELVTVTGHPHAGGEILGCPAGQGAAAGPSPRGWGNPRVSVSSSWDLRAIPTRVGKSHQWMRHGSRASGHPHAGGEILGLNGPIQSDPGPSPRGWGNPA